MKCWLLGAMIFFSANIMAQSGQNYKQQFAPLTKKEVAVQQKYYGTTEDKQYSAIHNYKKNLSKPYDASAVIEECDGVLVYESSSGSEREASQKNECDLSGGAYIEQNYKKTFSADKGELM